MPHTRTRDSSRDYLEPNMFALKKKPAQDEGSKVNSQVAATAAFMFAFFALVRAAPWVIKRFQ